MEITEAIRDNPKIFTKCEYIFFNPKKYFIYWIFRFLICKFVWDLQNNICGFNNFIKIWNRFSELIISSTMISKKYYDLHYIVPYRLP